MTQLRSSAAWRLFSFNWLPIGLMAAALALGMALTGFSIKPASLLIPLGAAAIYIGVAYYNVCVPHRRDPTVVFVLGSTAQLVLITLIMTPMTYVAATAGLPMADANLDYLDRALGLDWHGYFSFVYAHPQLIAAVVLCYSLIGLPVFAIPVALGMTRRLQKLSSPIAPLFRCKSLRIHQKFSSEPCHIPPIQSVILDVGSNAHHHRLRFSL